MYSLFLGLNSTGHFDNVNLKFQFLYAIAAWQDSPNYGQGMTLMWCEPVVVVV